MYKVTIDDLKGDVHDFPLHILQEMCNEQVRQGNPFAPEVFQDYRLYIKVFGGFDWSPSVKGFDYWHDLLVSPKFSAANIVSGIGWMRKTLIALMITKYDEQDRMLREANAPVPTRLPLLIGTKYYVPSNVFDGLGYVTHMWVASKSDYDLLSKGVVFLDKDDAKAYAALSR